MAVKLHTKKALLAALQNSERPIAVVVGAPVSIDADGGVPGVAGIVELARREVADRLPKSLAEFDKVVSEFSGANAYQAALEWIHARLLQDGVNRIIRNAVLLARKLGTSTEFEGDGDPEDWHIPAGPQQLATLVCLNSKPSIGPILTTNFDPLISLAVRSAGGSVQRRVLDEDGSLVRVAEREQDLTEVVHLHGYWRDSDTLHTSVQLEGRRKKLSSSMQSLLRSHNVLVVAYGGWHDVFMQALSDLALEDASRCSILWTFRDTDESALPQRYASLLQKLSPAIQRGRVTAYGGIDCHTIFGEICEQIERATRPVVRRAPLFRWELIDGQFLDRLPPLTSEEVRRYFDGALPTWRHAIDPTIPLRRDSRLLLTRLKGPVSSGDCILQLITGAGGEGKSTVLLQAAAHAARSGRWTVLWRPSPGLPLDVQQLTSLSKSARWLIVADDAETLVSDLLDACRELHARGNDNIFFLLAARDTDWIAAKGLEAPWGMHLTVLDRITLRGIEEEDADAVVFAWDEAGALRSLAKIPTHEGRVAALIQATLDKEVENDGSFFGALLQTRFDQEALAGHARELLSHLRHLKVGQDLSLLHALVFISALHSVGVPGMHPAVLAYLMGVAREWVRTEIVRRLGEETSVVETAGRVYTRHRRVAVAIVAEAEKGFGIDLAEIWSALVRATARLGAAVGINDPCYLRTIHASPQLPRRLPRDVQRPRRSAISLAAANAAAEALPNRLDCLVDLCTAYRLARRLGSARALFRGAYATLKDREDYEMSIRGFWYEWGVCEGAASDGALAVDACLQGRSISDSLRPAGYDLRRIAISCSGLGEAFGKLGVVGRPCVFQQGRRSVALLGLISAPDQRTRNFLKQHQAEAAAAGAREILGISEATTSVSTAIRAALKCVDDAYFLEILQGELFELRALASFLSRISRELGDEVLN